VLKLTPGKGTPVRAHFGGMYVQSSHDGASHDELLTMVVQPPDLRGPRPLRGAAGELPEELPAVAGGEGQADGERRVEVQECEGGGADSCSHRGGVLLEPPWDPLEDFLPSKTLRGSQGPLRGFSVSPSIKQLSP